jgi:hypothetical protein
MKLMTNLSRHSYKFSKSGLYPSLCINHSYIVVFTVHSADMRIHISRIQAMYHFVSSHMVLWPHVCVCGEFFCVIEHILYRFFQTICIISTILLRIIRVD